MQAGSRKVPCVGCGGPVPEEKGPTHPYMESSPGCWRIYGEVLSREYGDLAYAGLHQLTVDSYAVQHPGRPSPQTIQSVCLHLVSLHLVLERQVTVGYAKRIMGAGSKVKDRFHWLAPPTSLGSVTVADVARVAAPHEHEEAVRAWAASAWSAWAKHHAAVRGWARTLE